MNKYQFNPDRCKSAIEDLAFILRGIPVTDQETRRRFQYALDGLCLDIEALHKAAQERDMVFDIVVDLPTDEYGRVQDEDLDAFNWGWDADHVDENGKRIRIADLNL